MGTMACHFDLAKKLKSPAPADSFEYNIKKTSPTIDSDWSRLTEFLNTALSGKLIKFCRTGSLKFRTKLNKRL